MRKVQILTSIMGTVNNEEGSSNGCTITRSFVTMLGFICDISFEFWIVQFSLGLHHLLSKLIKIKKYLSSVKYTVFIPEFTHFLHYQNINIFL